MSFSTILVLIFCTGQVATVVAIALCINDENRHRAIRIAHRVGLARRH